MPVTLSADDLRKITIRLTEEADALREELTAAESSLPGLRADCERDAADLGAKAVALEALRADAERARAQLDQVLATLPTVGTPGYGRCAVCAGAIGRDRLLALPHTRACIDCARTGADGAA
ncbi:TraR/DksA family transcriptional regulator [Streptomyces sp. NPDC052040]|uniref:TraR/DksA family transcriptional regulator n=1 Tax=unclassified Streptomyces TaxID=2593676 RepID=UPI0037D20694